MKLQEQQREGGSSQRQLQGNSSLSPNMKRVSLIKHRWLPRTQWRKRDFWAVIAECVSCICFFRLSALLSSKPQIRKTSKHPSKAFLPKPFQRCCLRTPTLSSLPTGYCGKHRLGRLPTCCVAIITKNGLMGEVCEQIYFIHIFSWHRGCQNWRPKEPREAFYV